MQSSIHPIEDQGARARWEVLWERSPQRSPFSSLAYVEAVAGITGARIDLHLVEERGADVAGALVAWRKWGPYRQVVVPPFTPYAALLTAAPVDEALVHARHSPLDELIRSLGQRYHVLRFALHPTLADVRPFQWSGWHARPFYTYRLPLGDTGVLMGRWSANTRRVHQKSAAEYHVEERPDAAGIIARSCAASYARHGRRPPLDAGRIERLVAAARDAGVARLFVAGGRGEEAGGLAVLHDGREAAYWVAGSDPGPAMTVVLGDVLPRLFADGVAGFDFVGANTPTIAEFKRRFGPVLLPYYRVEHVTRPELRLLAK